MNSGNDGGPTTGAVGGFGGEGSGSEDNGTSGGGGGYLRGSRGTHNHQAGGEGGGTYYSGEDCSGLSSGNIKMTALCKLMNGWNKFKTLIAYHIWFSFTHSWSSSKQWS